MKMRTTNMVHESSAGCCLVGLVLLNYDEYWCFFYYMNDASTTAMSAAL